MQGRMVMEGRNGWLFFVPELRHLGAGPFWGPAAEAVGRATRVDTRDPLPAILAFNQELAAEGVKLIVVPVPPKAVVASDYLPDSTHAAPDARVDPHLAAFYDLLHAQGVDVLDLTGSFRQAFDSEQGPLYCLQDTHWSGAGIVHAAAVIAERVKPLLSDVGVGETTYATDWREIEINGDLWRLLDEPDRAKETVAVRVVEGASPDPHSPVLLLGDSHTLVFHAGGDMHYEGAGLADQLAVELGLPVDLIGVRGSGATPARINLFRRVQRDPTYWDGKKVVIWVFAAREFTESDGWRIVPIKP